MIGWLFSPAGAAVWCIVIVTGVARVVARWDAFIAQGSDVLAPANLGWLYLVFAAIKLCHEIGHAVCCKVMARREGRQARVGALGVMLLLFLPVPFVDASSAWALRRRWRRFAVGGAGTYVELVVAAVAAMAWSASAQGSLVNTLAHNAVLIASVSTLLFNLNPLLKYDGYYMLADLLEVPNLAQRAQAYAYYLVRRHAWGDRRCPLPEEDVPLRGWLGAYYVASGVFRIVVFASIALWVMGQWFFVGALAGACLIVGGVVAPLVRLAVFMADDPSLSRCRARAWGTTLGVLALLALGVGVVPFPHHLRLGGVGEARARADVFAGEGGVVVESLPDGAAVRPGGVILRQRNVELEAQRRIAAARLDAARAQQRRAVVEDAGKAAVEAERVRILEQALARLDERLERLTLRAPFAGVWSAREPTALAGAFVPAGRALGEVADVDGVVVRCVADQRQAGLLFQNAGELKSAQLRGAAFPDRAVAASVGIIRPGSSRLFNPALGEYAGGTLRTAPPQTPQAPTTASEPFFEVELIPIASAMRAGVMPRPGERVEARIDLPSAPLLSRLVRSVRQVFQERFLLPRSGA